MSEHAILGKKRRAPAEVLYALRSSDELPDELECRILYLVGEGQPWQAALLCPCGCKTLIQLSLLPNDRPRWKLTIEANDRPTLSPSIWRTDECRAHFFMRSGRIVWCGSNDGGGAGPADGTLVRTSTARD